jgi:hypothetical protein
MRAGNMHLDREGLNTRRSELQQLHQPPPVHIAIPRMHPNPSHPSAALFGLFTLVDFSLMVLFYWQFLDTKICGFFVVFHF